MKLIVLVKPNQRGMEVKFLIPNKHSTANPYHNTGLGTLSMSREQWARLHAVLHRGTFGIPGCDLKVEEVRSFKHPDKWKHIPAERWTHQSKKTDDPPPDPPSFPVST